MQARATVFGLLLLVAGQASATAQDDLTIDEVANVLETVDYGTRICDYELGWGLMTATITDWGRHFGLDGIAMKDRMRESNADIRAAASADPDRFCRLAKQLAIKLDMI